MRRWLAYRRSLRAIRKLKRFSSGHPDILRTVNGIERILIAGRPRIIRDSIRLIRALAVLFPVAFKSAHLWNDPSLSGVAARYPLEWKRAVALCPELEEVKDEEKY